MKKKFTFNLKTAVVGVMLMFSSGSFAQTVYDVIAGSVNHTSLTAAIDAAGLDAALQDPTATYTVFAPDNAAFNAFAAELGVTVGDLLLLPQADLADVLLYHVLNVEVGSGAVVNGTTPTPLNPANTLKLTVDGANVFVNQAQVNAADLAGTNGVVHSIDAVVVANETVADVAIDSPNHGTLVAAVVEARLLPALTNPWSSLTVFAPTDAAFGDALTALGITAGDLLASPDLADILLYHVLGAEVGSGDLANGDIANPLNTANTLKVTIDGANVFINQAQVSTPDVPASNGVVHVLDAVVLPVETVADIAIDSPNHTTLVAAVVEARLLPALTNPFASLTVFGPTDAAFGDALNALGITAGDLLASPDLADILLYHVLGAEVVSGDLANGDIATPLNNANTLKVTIDGANVFINQAQVSAADLGAANGVVHVLDAVVLPVETVADIAIDSPDHTTLVAAVVEARLLPALTNPFASLTVFGPNNAAFGDALTELGITAGDLLASPDLTDILLYHVLGAEVVSGDLANGDIANPLNNANTLKVTIDGANVFINQAQVSVADLGAANGVVHVLDAVVLPVETVADIAIDSPDHSTLVAAVIEARLLPALTDPFTELTVFAPTDAAFTTFLTAEGITAGDLLASPDLADILLYHVVEGTVLSTDLTNGTVTALNGGTLTVDVTMTPMINNANVTGADNLADNGAVHVIDAVLVESTASLEDVENLSISMYPNPATDFITINSNENGTYTIVDIMGAVVAEGAVANNSINVSALMNGTYFVNFATENGVYQGRFVKN